MLKITHLYHQAESEISTFLHLAGQVIDRWIISCTVHFIIHFGILLCILLVRLSIDKSSVVWYCSTERTSNHMLRDTILTTLTSSYWSLNHLLYGTVACQVMDWQIICCALLFYIKYPKLSFVISFVASLSSSYQVLSNLLHDALLHTSRQITVVKSFITGSCFISFMSTYRSQNKLYNIDTKVGRSLFKW